MSSTGQKNLTHAELEGLEGRINEAFSYNLKEFQLHAVKEQLLGKDVLVHAGTGSGKTAIAAGPHLHSKSKGKVTLIVSPLIALHDKQVETYQTEFNLTATAVNSSHSGCQKEILNKIVKGEWQIVLVSPEMLLSRRFISHVLRNTEFGKRILSVVIDEAHVVSHWGSQFRKKYGSLGILRAFLPQGTPFIAVSATLPPRIRADVLTKLQFPKDHVVIDVGNDRPNVSIVVHAFQHPMNSFADLDFVIGSGITSGSQIKKTFVYTDSIEAGIRIVDHLKEILPVHLRNRGLIRPYNAVQGKIYRKKAMDEFKSRNICVLVCTDAAGMGCNIPDIDVVVQWKLPSSVSSFVQRAGKEGRGKKGKAKKPKGKNQKEKKNYAKDHGVKRGSRGGQHDEIWLKEQPKLDPMATDEGLYVLAQTGVCRRMVLTEIFSNKKAAPTVACCDLCSLSLLDLTWLGVGPKATQESAPKRGKINRNLSDHLCDWWKMVWTRDYGGALFAPTGILANDVLDLLSSVGPIPTMKTLSNLLEGRWGWYSTYGKELHEFLLTLDIPPMVPLLKKSQVAKGTAAAVENADAGITADGAAALKRRQGVDPAIMGADSGPASQDAVAAPAPKRRRWTRGDVAPSRAHQSKTSEVSSVCTQTQSQVQNAYPNQ
ncbi:hypothetical protein JAAARDRAFT_62158 [Jaapia argillacea MUCL 33604]|uniref:DNA 3'-5' helicase n=1 Tax=Jaapia argillacea MUCL 33604 TaxID=933084 RepID=A0A067PAR6_9AGAM|nr:hypothetical protein JAAARDRAFT_62158 [Jaapia argillacea MUCL 33604]